MIYKKLTRNFNFIEDEDFKIDESIKQSLIDKIYFLEKSLKKNEDLSNIFPSNLWDALAFTLNAWYKNDPYLTDEEKADFINKDPDKKLSDIKDKFDEYSWFISSMYNIKKIRNYFAHLDKSREKIKMNLDKIACINYLKDLYIIIINIFHDFEIVPNEYNFIATEYDIELKDNNLDAINEETRKKNEEYTSIVKDISITHDTIYNWLTIPNAKIVIPIYQRKYTWKEENVKTLLNDIDKRILDRQTHYFGTIAQKKQPGQTNHSLDFIKIIDGQQRLTTSLLIVCATRDLLKEKFNIEYKDMDWYIQINNNNKLEYYISNPGGTEESNNIFKTILSHDNKIILDKKNQKDHFLTNYKYIYSEIQRRYKTKDKIILFINIFLRNFHVATINFSSNTFSNKSEMEIFENLNSKGLDLNIPDLIKNHLFNFCSDELLEGKDANRITINYNNLINNIACLKKENEINDFFQTLAELLNGYELPNEKNSKFSVIQDKLNSFFSEYKDISTIKLYDEFLDELEKYMWCFSEICKINKANNFTKYLCISNIVNIISDKKKLKLFSYISYIIIMIIEKVKNKKLNFRLNSSLPKLEKNEIKAIQDLYIELTKFIIRTKIITSQGDSEVRRKIIEISNDLFCFTKNCNSIIDLCEKGISLINKIYENKYKYDDFKNNLERCSNYNQLRELLLLTESIMGNTLYGDGDYISRKSNSIEHIMPQDIKKWISDYTNEEKQKFIEEHNKVVNEIGNLLILTNNNNSKIKNNIFKIKKEKVYNNLNSPLYKNTNKSISVEDKDEWTFKNIKERTKELNKYIIENVITK